jgi:hypothetical protein
MFPVGADGYPPLQGMDPHLRSIEKILGQNTYGLIWRPGGTAKEGRWNEFV